MASASSFTLIKVEYSFDSPHQFGNSASVYSFYMLQYFHLDWRDFKMHCDSKKFSDSSTFLINEVDVTARLGGTTEITFKLPSIKDSVDIFDILKSIPVSPQMLPCNRITVGAKLHETNDIFCSLARLKNENKLSISLYNDIVTNYPNGSGGTKNIAPPLYTVRMDRQLLIFPLAIFPSFSALQPQVGGTLDANIDALLEKDNKPLKNISAYTLLKNHSLFSELEDKFITENRHCDARLQKEYDKRYGLMILK